MAVDTTVTSKKNRLQSMPMYDPRFSRDDEVLDRRRTYTVQRKDGKCFRGHGQQFLLPAG